MVYDSQVRGSHGPEMCFGLASWLHFMALYGFSAQCSLVCTVAIVCVHEFTVYISCARMCSVWPQNVIKHT